MAAPKILLAHLNSNGDCLFATVIARQIKEVDYPGCHLTWAVNSKCKQSVFLNPFVDAIWEVPTASLLTSKEEWEAFKQSAEEKKDAGEFDQIFYTQIIGENIINYDGGIRSSIYNNYPHKITVPQQPILVLSEHEVDEVKAFALQHQLQNFKKVILIECGPDSFTSALNPLSARDMAETLVNENPGIACILSSNKKIHTPTPQIIDGSVLNFRANAALTHYCHLFIGCSSGISWITTTQSAKPLQKIIIINPADYYTSSMVHDHEWSGLPTTDIIEMHTHNNVLTEVAEVAQLILNGNFVAAKNKYHKHFKLQNYKYVYHQTKEWLSRKDFAAPAKAWQRTSQRNGFTLSSLLNLIKGYIKFPFSSLEKKKNN